MTTAKNKPHLPARLWLSLIVVVSVGPAQGQPSGLGEQPARRRTPVVEVFEAAKGAVVNISSTQIVEVRSPLGLDRFFEDVFDLPRRSRTLKRTSVGSGFVIHPAGYIVTNAHVVARTAEQKAIFADKREYDAQVVAVDQDRDLAVLKIDPPEPLTPLPLGSSTDLMIGETAIAIGNPLGYQHTVTAGVVSALDRTLDINQEMSFHGLIQTDASINPGNSGGPLLNVLGELIGINTAIRGDAQNIGFAIPVDQLRDLLPDLLDVERRYRIVTGLRVSHDNSCRIEHVEPGSQAQQASLSVGDVITQIDGQPIQSAIDFHIALIGRQPGGEVRLMVRRGGRDVSALLILGQRAQPDGAKLLVAHFGIEAEPLTPKMARAMSITGLTGLMITRIERGSPAHRAKLERGDVLVSIGRHQAAGLDDVGELLESVQTGQAVDITIIRVVGRVVYRMATRLRAR